MRRLCIERGCPHDARPGGARCADHQRLRDRERNARRKAAGELQPYQSAAYRRLRREITANAERCTYCGVAASVAPLTVDHIQRVRLHPELATDPRNLVPACRSCQMRKQYQPGGGRFFGR